MATTSYKKNPEWYYETFIQPRKGTISDLIASIKITYVFHIFCIRYAIVTDSQIISKAKPYIAKVNLTKSGQALVTMVNT